VSAPLVKADPIGIAFDNENLDEYNPEARTIIPRLKNCGSEEDMLRVVYEEFVRWFRADDAGPRERYRQIAKDIWNVWQTRKGRSTSPQA